MNHIPQGGASAKVRILSLLLEASGLYDNFIKARGRIFLDISISNESYMSKPQPAPYNPRPQWPRQYYEALARMGVDPKHFSYYAYWVRQLFRRHPGRRHFVGPPLADSQLAVLR